MTDIAGTEEPARTDERALEESLPIISIGPGAAGVAVPALVVAADPLDDPELEAEPEGRIDLEPDQPDPLA